jgi:ribosomal protein S14
MDERSDSEAMICVTCGNQTPDTSPFGMCRLCLAEEAPLPGWDEWTGERLLP